MFTRRPWYCRTVQDEDYRTALEKFAVADNKIASSDKWVVVLRPKQVTLGALVLIPDRGIDDFDGLEPDEALNFFALVARCQAVLRLSFQPDRFNLVAAMMKDPFVHFHLIPRYADTREFEGTIWTDESWPDLIDFRTAAPESPARTALLEHLRSAFAGV
jgi:diadenosine tetraphosphate (Ap4A) HIT family hydrolase